MTFLFFSLGQDVVHSYGKEFAPGGANSFPYELTLFQKGGNYENCRVTSPETVPISLKQ